MEEKDRIRKYLDIAGVIFVVIDVDQTVRFVNKKGCEVLQCAQEEIVGRQWFDTFFPERVKSELKEAFGKLVSGEIVPVEYLESPVLVRGREERVVAWHNTLLKDDEGNIQAVLSSGEDVTRRKRAEERLKQAMEELKRSNAELEQFAYIASHDLQQPLLVVDGFLKLLQRRYKGKLGSDADEFIGAALDGTKQMQTLIRDLLEYARVGRGKISDPVDASDCLDRALANLKMAIEESAAVITHDGLPEITANATLLTQLFQNLLSNAIKYRREEPPRIHIAVAKRETNWLFSIRDNGIGIAPEHTERIFDAFYRLHSRTERQGSGIGLAVCKKIVERHGGHIWVESEKGKGSTFHFTIPINDRNA